MLSGDAHGSVRFNEFCGTVKIIWLSPGVIISNHNHLTELF